MQFRSVPEPREIQELINKRVKGSRGEPTTESGETKRDVLDGSSVNSERSARLSTHNRRRQETHQPRRPPPAMRRTKQSTGEDNTSQNEFVVATRKPRALPPTTSRMMNGSQP